MKPVEIKYQPFRWLRFTRTAKGNCPQNWGDVTPKQLIAIACLYKGIISEISFLNTMTGLPKRALKKLDDYSLLKLMELIEFIADRKPYHEFIIKKLKVSPWGIVPIAPGGKLKGITFGQFIFADTYYSNYQESKNEEDMNKFIASLFLCSHEQFEEWIPEQRHAIIAKVDSTVREAIVINYQLMHEWLSIAYPLIFQKVEEQLVQEEGKEPPQRDPNMWIKVFQNFVGDDILHDDVWAAKPVNTIFAYMTRKYKENARRKKK